MSRVQDGWNLQCKCTLSSLLVPECTDNSFVLDIELSDRSQDLLKHIETLTEMFHIFLRVQDSTTTASSRTVVQEHNWENSYH